MVIIDGDALDHLQATILAMAEVGRSIYKISVEQRDEGVAIKINEAMWSATIPTDTQPVR